MSNNLKHYREKRGMSLQDLADEAKTGRSYVWEVETGRKVPTVYIGQRLCKAVKAPLIKVFPLPAEG